MTQIDLSQFSAAELENLLAQKKRQEREDYARRKADYEAGRDKIVTEMFHKAKQLSLEMQKFKAECVERLNEFSKEAHRYGDIRSNSKGGFSLRNSDKSLMVVYERNTKPEYDERSQMAETLLKEFLEDKIKRKDLQTYRTIAALMERNKKGDYTPARVASLMKIRDNYDDPRWVKAMQLFEESFQVIDISMSVSFYEKDEQEKDQMIPLTFASM
jgi:hypothetical protein